MAYLEKLIKYDQALLDPAPELEIVDNGSRLRLKPLDRLVYLSHFEKETAGASDYGVIYEEINRIALIGTISGHQLTTTLAKFGNSCLRDYANKYAVSVSDIPEAVVQAPELTIDFWYRPNTANTNGKIRSLVERWYPHWCWRISHVNRELKLDISNAPSSYVTLQTLGLNLDALTYYHIRATMRDGDEMNLGQAKIFVDGNEVAGCGFSGAVNKFGQGFDKSCLKILNSLDYSSLVACYLDELRIFDQYRPDNFTPPSQATKPFSQDLPKARVSLDAGAANALWILSDLAFLDETDLLSGGIKIRADADNDNTPSFSGDLLTLSQTRMLANLPGRYLHLEFNFDSDGDTQRTLYAGKVGLQSQRLALARQAPEIIARF